MFKKDSTVIEDDLETIIGPSVKLEGDFKSNGDVTVEGKVKGTLATTKNLRVGEKALIEANVSAENATIAGIVKGNIGIKGKLEILNSGEVHGDVICKSIIIQEGAKLNGTWSMSDNQSAKKETIKDIIESHE